MMTAADRDWEAKKAKQRAEMARGKGVDPTTLGNSALGIQGIGQQSREATNRDQARQPTYPTPADLPKYDSIAGARAGQQQAMSNMLSPGFGQGYFAKPNPKPTAAPSTQAASVPTSDKAIADAENPIYNTTNDPISAEQGGKSYGLSITPSPDKPNAAQAFAQALQANAGQQGAGIPNTPRRGIQGIKERDALIKQASTVQDGARGITAAQMGVLAGLQNNDDKFANDQYQAQLGAASNMAQAQVRESNANARAALGEVSAAERQGQQLGFDAEKFQQSTALDNRRLDIAQGDSDIKNFTTKERNQLYKQWEAAETDEDKNAILAKMNTLSGTGKDGEKWKAIKGAQTIQNGLPVDGEPLLLNERTGETRPIGGAPVQLDMGNPKVAEIMNNTKTSYEQKMAELDALGVVTQ